MKNKCQRCQSNKIAFVTQYTVNLYINGCHNRTEYLNNDSRENINKRLNELFKNYEFDFYSTGSYESCDECDYIQNHDVITQNQMAYGKVR